MNSSANSTHLSERHRAADLEQAAVQNTQRRPPGWAVGVVAQHDAVAIRRVIEVEIQLQASTGPHSKPFAQPQIELVAPGLEKRVRCDERHRGRSSTARQVAAQRGQDLGRGRRVVRIDWLPGDVLEGAAYDEVAWQRVAPVQFDLQVGRPSGDSPAGSLAVNRRGGVRDRGGRGARNVGYGRAAGGHGAGRIDVEAKVVQDTPGVDATGEPRAGGEPRVDADVDEVVRVDLLPVMRRLRHHVLDLSEFVLVDVV